MGNYFNNSVERSIGKVRVSLKLDNTRFDLVLSTPSQDWILDKSCSNEEVFFVRTFKRWEPSPVMEWHSKISGSYVTLPTKLG